MPIYVQRQFSECLTYVLPDRISRWRLNWFNELKIPLLTAPILLDNGNHSLDERMRMLNQLVTENIVPTLPEQSPTVTPEELFLCTGIRNRRLHAKAKMYIMEMINVIKDPKKRLTGNKFRIDPATVTTEQVFSALCENLAQDDPEIAGRILVRYKNKERGEIDLDKDIGT